MIQFAALGLSSSRYKFYPIWTGKDAVLVLNDIPQHKINNVIVMCITLTSSHMQINFRIVYLDRVAREGRQCPTKDNVRQGLGGGLGGVIPLGVAGGPWVGGLGRGLWMACRRAGGGSPCLLNRAQQHSALTQVQLQLRHIAGLHGSDDGHVIAPILF